MFTTNVVDDCWNAYPIYDWEVADDWTYIARENLPYNALYDRMHQAGLTPHQMRIDEPFGETQRIGLWLYQIIEPQLWAKMVARVAGANTGALYSTSRGNMLGVHSLKLSEGRTWKQFAMLLLDTMPPSTAEHYRNKIAKYLHWYGERGYPDEIPDEAPAELETQRKNLVPSWRLVCKNLLRNDYWCSTLGFSPTKSSAYSRYLDLMRRKRDEWGLFPTQAAT
jgi:predicted phosphoadenosine phosphosulfate sulfurtransferase